MDSASSSLAYVSREGSPTEEEDDGALLVAAGLAKEAALLFQAGKFVDCLTILNHLLEKKADDSKVHHNIAIAQSFHEGCSDPRRLIEALENVKKQSEKLALASGGDLEVSKNNGNKHTVSIRGSNMSAHQFSSSSVRYSDEFDTAVTMFNLAVIWFHLHEYAKSFSYLETLYQNIEPIGEGTALRICLLLLDVALLSHHASRSADVISYMEKVFCVNSLTNQVDSGTSTEQQTLLVSNSSSFISNSTTNFDSVVSTTTNPSESCLTRSLSEEALEDEPLQLLSSFDISRHNLQRPSIASSNDLPSLSVADLRLKLHLYKVRFFILTRNLKAAKREVKMAMNIDHPMALYLKSQLEYARGNHRKAIKLLMASSSNCMETGVGISSMYYNNLGCVYYRLGKYHTSGVFFTKALKSSSLVRKEKPPKLVTFSQDKSLLITYNCGAYSLACGKPFHAARCFQMASLIFYNQPLLWLRIAECCLMALEKGLINSISSASDIIRVNVIGKGKWRQLALRYGRDNVGKDNLFSSDGKQPHLSMSLAWQCLVNALYLLDSLETDYSKSEESESRETVLSNHKNGDPKEISNVVSGSSQVTSNGEMKEQKGGNNQSGWLQNTIPDYECIRMKEKQMIKQAALADLAYVELELGNPLKALSTAKSLTKLPECSRVYTFLGTMYAAEALCLLNQTKEAAEHLMMYVSGGNNVDLPYSQEDCEKWSIEKVVDGEESNGVVSGKCVFSSPEEGRGTFCANYAANFALMGELDKAHYFVMKALSDMPNSSQAIVTAIYVDLKRGNTQDALAKLKHHTATRILPTLKLS
ncbi:hypothetical protein BUALT_Bualt12G0092900 [Buddleja alternifolia]|uniref:CCR4-NOT transcription complex subunit 10 n=1 Tax=Buddleja alternifolia TaxID=168488 RepID=A0AAV6WX54_9LAMI|nr:hypothetical protein BUALT_Bualt12G0092900 [Buddleja alternifolia]